MYVPNFYMILPYQTLKASLKKYNIVHQLFHPSNITSSLQNYSYTAPPTIAPAPNQPVTWTTKLYPKSATLDDNKSQQIVTTSNINVDIRPSDLPKSVIQTENKDIYPMSKFPQS
jgi:hypothetical protein